MKKTLSIILIIAALMSVLSSCSTVFREIKSVRVHNGSYGMTYQTIYVYAFDDAQIDNYSREPYAMDHPTRYGYVYSTEKLKVGDSIKVWQQFDFGAETTSLFNNTGTYATVAEIVETYKVSARKKLNSYVITYYSLDDYTYISYTTVTNKTYLAKIEKHVIEVSNGVQIEYYS